MLKAKLSMDYSIRVVLCSVAASEDSNVCPVSLSEASCTILQASRLRQLMLHLYNKLHKYNDMRVVSFSEARNSLKSVLDHVVEDADYTIITRRDAEDAVVMSLEYFNSLLETVYLLKSPANAAHLERSIAQFKQGQVVDQDLVND